MSAFKVGDRVRHKYAADSFSGGKIATVVKVFGEYLDARLPDGIEGTSKFDCWELVDPPAPTPETRALDLIRRIATGLVASTVAADEARAIMKDVEPDGDLIEARKIAAECEDAPYGTLEDVALAAIRRGRALERGEP